MLCCFQSLTSSRKKSSPSSFLKARRLSGSAPDVLEVAVTLSEAVDAVIRLAHGADEAAESVGLGLAVESAVLVDLCDGDLDGTVVLGLDDAVGGAALAGDVTAVCENMSAFLLCFFSLLPASLRVYVCFVCISFCRSRARFGRSVTAGRGSWDSRGIVQVDEFSAFVLHGDGVVRLVVGEKKMGLRDDDVRRCESGRGFRQAPSPFRRQA